MLFTSFRVYFFSIFFVPFSLFASSNNGELGWDKRVIHGTLDNGFRYYLFDSRQDKESSEGLTIANLLVSAGAIDEEEDQLGVAHMVEHMVFHESDRFPNSVRKALTDLGLKQGRGFNAMTNSENTRYMVNLKNTTTESLDSLLSIYRQIAFHAQIKKNSLTKERLIIEEEWRAKLSHRSNINEDKKAILKVGSLYPERPVIGTQESIKNTPAERLKSFYHDWYAPNNMALIIFSPEDMKALEAKIQLEFSKEKSRTLPVRHSKNPILDTNIKMGQLTDSGSKINRVAFLYRFEKTFLNNDKGRRDGLINYMARRLLTQQIRRQRGSLPDHVRTLNSTKGELTEGVDILGFSVNVDNGFHQKGLMALAQELERIKRYGFFQEDFDELFQQVIETTRRNKRVAKTRGNIWSIKMVEAVALGRPLVDPEESNDQTLRLIQTVTLDDINTRLREWLSSPDRVLYTQAVAGDNVDIGTPELVEGIFDTVSTQELAAPNQKKIVAKKILPQVERKGSIDLISRDEGIGLSKWRLSNGDQLVLLNPTILSDVYQPVLSDSNSEKDISYFSAFSSAGYRVKIGSFWAQQIAQQMSEATGVYGWTDEEFQQWRTENHILLSSKQTAQSLTYRGSILDGSLGELLNFYHHHHVVPEIDVEVYDAVMADLKRSASVSVVRPIEAFARQLAQTRFGRKEPAIPTVSILQGLSHEYLEKIRQKQVVMPTQYFMVSRLPESDIIHMVSRYLATIPRVPNTSSEGVNGSVGEKGSIVIKNNTKPILQLPGKKTVDVSLNPEPKAEYRLYAYQSLPWSPVVAVQLVYLGERLEDELKIRLRSQAQGVYSVRAVLDLDKDTDRVELVVQYSSDPARLDDLAMMVDDVLVSFSNDISSEWVKEAHAEFLDIEQNRFLNAFDSTLMHRLELSENYYGDARYLRNMTQLTEALTEENLKRLAKSLIFENRIKGLYRPVER